MPGLSRRTLRDGLSRITHVGGLSVVLLLLSLPRHVLSGDLAFYPTPLQADNRTEISVRQTVCERYIDVATGVYQLKNALSGLELRPILTTSRFFNYDEETGIDETDPGLAVLILDELAQRAKFTWRNSFAVSNGPEPNTTWTQMLELYTEVFDISIDYWDKNSERLNRGIAFLDRWFDGNMILIEKVEPIKDKTVNYTNFLKPFSTTVWLVTLATVVASAFIYQWLEYLNNERDERTFWQWFEENLFSSSMNFTQQYAYEPTSSAGRIFGFSMAVWAMVIGATYTANLASLFVEGKGEPTKVADIEDAIRQGYKFCTWAGTNSDQYIKKRYPQAIRVPKPSELEAYQGLHTGECGVTVGAMATWEGYELDKNYNMYCDLEWVGRTIEEVSSAFAVKADPALKCTNLIRDVLNFHLSEMTVDGKLEDLWNAYYASIKTIDCATYEPGDEEVNASSTESRRLLFEPKGSNSRQLKGGGGGGANPAAAANGGDEGGEESSSLSMSAMAGTFVLHAILCGVAIIVGTLSWYRKKTDLKFQVESKSTEENDSHDGDDFASHFVSQKSPVGRSLVKGTSTGDSNYIDSFTIKHGSAQEQMKELFEAQRQLQSHQYQLTQQMDLVVSMLTKMQENNETATQATAETRFSFFS